jgi:hypothetical protein
MAYVLTMLIILGLTTNGLWLLMKSQVNENQQADRISEWTRGFPEVIRKYRKLYPHSHLPIVATVNFALFLILLVALVIISVVAK